MYHTVLKHDRHLRKREKYRKHFSGVLNVRSVISQCKTLLTGRRGGLKVSEHDSGSSGPGSSPGQGHCVVFLGKKLNSHSVSVHPRV